MWGFGRAACLQFSDLKEIKSTYKPLPEGSFNSQNPAQSTISYSVVWDKRHWYVKCAEYLPELRSPSVLTLFDKY